VIHLADFDAVSKMDAGVGDGEREGERQGSGDESGAWRNYHASN
jgi:hypothetical protein